MEVALIIGVFISTSLALNFLVSQKVKLSGAFNVISLCLIVAIAYQFDQVKNIIWVLAIAAAIVIAYFLLKMFFKAKKKKSTGPIDVDVIESKE